MSSSSSSLCTATEFHHLTSVDWQKRGKNCEVCAKKKIVNPVNVYCSTCDKYFCHCCLICHQEFTTGHVTTQRFTICGTGTEHHPQEEDPSKNEHGLTFSSNSEQAGGTEDGSSPDSKKTCIRQDTTDVVYSVEGGLEKNEGRQENAPVCCGQGSIAEINKKQKSLPTTPAFEESKQWCLSEVTADTYITGITITDKGDLFMCDSGNSKVFGYNFEQGLLLSWCQIPHSPIDICSVTSTQLATVTIVKQFIYFLEWTADCKTLILTASVSTGKKLYCSICKSGESFLLACDCFTNVDILNFQGELLSSVFTGRYLPPTSTYIHRICPGQTTCSFWILDYNSQVISCCTLNGLRLGSQCLRSQNQCHTDDIVMDKSGLVYGCDIDKVYYCMPNKERFQTLISFQNRLLTDARMCWTPMQSHLVMCLETSEGYIVKIFKKS